MIEVFKTNITCADQAKQLIEKIDTHFSYQANFDLHDCDKVLRVVSKTGTIAPHFADWLKNYGCNAETLPDY